MDGFPAEQLPPAWPTPPRAPEPPPPGKPWPHEPPARPQHYASVLEVISERTPSLPTGDVLPGPDQHPLAVAAIWIAAVGVSAGLLMAQAYANSIGGLISAGCATVMGALAFAFALSALVTSRRRVLPAIAGVLGVVLMATGPILGLASWRLIRPFTQTIVLSASVPTGSGSVVYQYGGQTKGVRGIVPWFASGEIAFNGTWSTTITLHGSRGNPAPIQVMALAEDGPTAAVTCAISAAGVLLDGPRLRDPSSSSVYLGVQCEAIWPG